MRKDNRILETLDFEELTDEQIDDLFRPRKANSAKSLAPLYVYLILKGRKGEHFTQGEIARVLEDRYEVKLERKALNRILHSLDDANVGIVSTSNEGSWYDAA